MIIQTTRPVRAAVAFAGGLLLLTACSNDAGGSASASGAEPVSVVGFSVLESANNVQFEGFQASDAAAGATFKTSYGSSGDQSRAVEGGLDADLVHLSLEPDMDRLVEAGLVAEDWKSGPTRGIATSSVVVFVVREGNPKGIESWDDLVSGDVEIITPNPASSGSAKWNILAAWGHVLANGGSDEDAEAFLKSLLENTIALPSSAREATTAFSEGNGDVLLSYENEAILARQGGESFEYVVPTDTLLIENPAAVTEDAPEAAQAFLDYLLTPEAQAVYATFGFRPVVDGVDLPEVESANDPANPFPEPKTLLTVDEDFGGWDEANVRFFDEEDGIVPKLQAETGTAE